MDPDQIRRDAEELLKAQALPAALQRFEDLVALAPDDGRNWTGLGRALLAADCFEAGLEAMQRACALSPGDPRPRTALASVLQGASRVEEAIDWHGQALALAPDSLVLRLNHACVWPVVATSTAQILACRERCQEALERLQHDVGVQLHPSHEACNHTFGLAYHGIDDRAWLENYARLVIRHVAGEEPAANQTLPPGAAAKGQGRRLRLGFLSAYFYGHSNSRAFEGLLRGLDRERFERVLIHLSASHDDAVRRRLDADADAVLHCPANVVQAWQQLQQLNLDLLFITDVGMNPELPALLSRRCAPVQVTGWGFPRTSGFPTIDYYLSSDLAEPADGQEHYSETLVRLTGLPCRYRSEDLPVDPLAASIGRAYFLLPEEAPLVGCLQTFWKLHPDFDTVLEQIARRIPEAWFVFVAPNPPQLAEVFLSRLSRSAPTAAARIVLLNRVKRSEFGVLAGCLDLQLDTLHFGSGISFYEAIHTGTPILTVEGPFLRSRYVAAAYRLMGLEDAPVCHSGEAMAELAIALLLDPTRRERLRHTITAAARAHLYDRMDVVHSFEAFADEAITRAQWQGNRP